MLLNIKSKGSFSLREGAMRCSLVAGLIKTDLSSGQRERFVTLLSEEFKNCPNGRTVTIKGKRSAIMCQLVHEDNQEGIEESGGCIVRFHDDMLGIQRNYETVTPYEHWMNGTGSFVEIDDANCTVCAGRDVGGAEVLYFAIRDGTFYFANSLILFRRFSFSVSRRAASDFFHFLYIPAPRTIYEEVTALLPGSIAIFDGENVKTRCYPDNPMDRPAPNFNAGSDATEFIESFEVLMGTAMRRCCAGASRVALFLSGGKDSSALAIAAKLSGLKQVETVTLGFNNSNVDESADAATVARYLALSHRCLTFTAAEYLKYFPDFIRSMGQPLGDPAALPIYAAMRAIAGDYDILLDGTGNDRYFGIPTTWQEDFAWYMNRIMPGLHLLPWHIILESIQSYSLSSILRHIGRSREEQFVSWNGWSSEEINDLTGSTPAWCETPLYDLYTKVGSSMDHKTQTLCVVWEPEAAYRKTVQMAESFGRIVRYPFRDMNLVRWGVALPTSLKHRGRVNKIILRAFLEKHLPSEIVTKRKGAFVFPKEYILATDNYKVLNMFLSPERLRVHAIVDPQYVIPYLKRYQQGDKTVEDRIWALLLLHAWLEYSSAI